MSFLGECLGPLDGLGQSRDGDTADNSRINSRVGTGQASLHFECTLKEQLHTECTGSLSSGRAALALFVLLGGTRTASVLAAARGASISGPPTKTAPTVGLARRGNAPSIG